MINLKISNDTVQIIHDDGKTLTYKLVSNPAKTLNITSGVDVAGNWLLFENEKINIADIDAVFDENFSTYLLTGSERKYITSTLNDINGEMAKRIAQYCPHLTEFNDNVFIVKNKIKDFLIDAKSNYNRTKNHFAGFNIGAVVGKSFVPVSWEKNFDDAVIKRDELCKTYCVK